MRVVRPSTRPALASAAGAIARTGGGRCAAACAVDPTQSAACPPRPAPHVRSKMVALLTVVLGIGAVLALAALGWFNDDTVVHLPDGGGSLRGSLSKARTRSFVGVPFAQPPVGALRWRPPQPLREPLQALGGGPFDATRCASPPRAPSFPFCTLTTRAHAPARHVCSPATHSVYPTPWVRRARWWRARAHVYVWVGRGRAEHRARTRARMCVCV